MQNIHELPISRNSRYCRTLIYPVAIWRASVASETLTGVTQSKIGDVSLFIYWRASVASETLTGVTQSKIGDVCLLASERSERDTLRGNAIEISLYLFIYLFMGYVRPLFSPALLIT